MRYKDFILIQLALSFLSFISASIGIVHDVQYSYIGIFLMVLLTTVVVLQALRFEHKCIAKGILLVLYFFGIITLAGGDLVEPDLFAGWSALFSGIFLVMSFILLFIDEDDKTTEIGEAGYLPRGFYGLANLLVHTGIFTLACAVAVAVILFVHSDLASVLCVLGVFVVIFAQVLVQINIMLTPFTDYKRDLDFARLERRVLVWSANDRLHPETRNALNILLALILGMVNIARVNEYRQKITEPKVKRYRFYYDLLSVNIFKGEDLTAEFGVLESKYSAHRVAEAKAMWRATLGELDEDIDKEFPLETKRALDGAINTYIRARYCLQTGDTAQAQALKADFVAKYSALDYLVRRLQDIKTDGVQQL